MRAIVLVVLLVGCSAPAEPQPGSENPIHDGPAAPEAPTPLRFAGRFVGADLARLGPCDGSVSCATHTFETNRTWIVTVTLDSIDGPLTRVPRQSAGLGSDYDMRLAHNGTWVAASAAGSPSESISREFARGRFDVEVWAFLDVDGRYEVTVGFDVPVD